MPRKDGPITTEELEELLTEIDGGTYEGISSKKYVKVQPTVQLYLTAEYIAAYPYIFTFVPDSKKLNPTVIKQGEIIGGEYGEIKAPYDIVIPAGRTCETAKALTEADIGGVLSSNTVVYQDQPEGPYYINMWFSDARALVKNYGQSQANFIKEAKGQAVMVMKTLVNSYVEVNEALHDLINEKFPGAIDNQGKIYLWNSSGGLMEVEKGFFLAPDSAVEPSSFERTYAEVSSEFEIKDGKLQSGDFNSLINAKLSKFSDKIPGATLKQAYDIAFLSTDRFGPQGDIPCGVNYAALLDSELTSIHEDNFLSPTQMKIHDLVEELKQLDSSRMERIGEIMYTIKETITPDNTNGFFASLWNLLKYLLNLILPSKYKFDQKLNDISRVQAKIEEFVSSKSLALPAPDVDHEPDTAVPKP